MAESTLDPTFYRGAAEAAAAPEEQLAYVVAFDCAAEDNDAMTVIDVDRTATADSPLSRTGAYGWAVVCAGVGASLPASLASTTK